MSKQLNRGLLIALLVFSAFPGAPVLAQQTPAGAAPANPDVDARRSIMTRPNERTHILSSMRKYLIGLQKMTEALAREDMKAAAEAARSMGNINLYEVKLMFPNAAAVEFRQLALIVHKDFESVAIDAEAKKDAKLMLGQVAAIMKKCTYCHETYRLQDTAH